MNKISSVPLKEEIKIKNNKEQLLPIGFNFYGCCYDILMSLILFPLIFIFSNVKKDDDDDVYKTEDGGQMIERCKETS
jgi:hypothetical protein